MTVNDRQERAKPDRDWLVTVEMGAPEDGPVRIAARSASAARYALFKKWIEAGYGWRFHNAHEAFVYFSRNFVRRVELAPASAR